MMGLKAFYVKRNVIKKALDSMNCSHGFMNPKVVKVVENGEDFIVFVDIANNSPYVENQWGNFAKGLDFYEER